MQGGLLYISSMLKNRSVKLLTIYIALCIPLCNISVKKEKYHKLQFCGAVTNFFHNIIFKLQNYYITLLTIESLKNSLMSAFNPGQKTEVLALRIVFVEPK